MTQRRNLRKGERDVAEAAAAGAFATALPAMHQIERVIKEELLPAVPPELAEHAVRKFMNLMGEEIWAEAEIARVLDA